MLGAENACWGQDRGCGCSKTELAVKRCCWGLKDAAGGSKHTAGAQHLWLGG